MNIFLELTHKFNTDKLRAIISSGQAVVLHRLAIMSKDGDWIIMEDSETTEYILKVLAGYSLQEAHKIVITRASGVLPIQVKGV